MKQWNNLKGGGELNNGRKKEKTDKWKKIRIKNNGERKREGKKKARRKACTTSVYLARSSTCPVIGKKRTPVHISWTQMSTVMYSNHYIITVSRTMLIGCPYDLPMEIKFKSDLSDITITNFRSTQRKEKSTWATHPKP
jgi:hypothetical protein